MSILGGAVSAVKQAASKPKPTPAKPQYGGSYVGGIPYITQDFRPELANQYRATAAANPGVNRVDVIDYVNSGGAKGSGSKPAPKKPAAPKKSSSSSSGGSRGYTVRRSGGGGGGGGGGPSAATKAAQAQIDAITGLLNSGAYKVNPATYDTMRSSINSATTQDQTAATNAYNSLDTYLQGHQSNPYANVTMTHAAQAPSYNPYLQSQGIAGSAPMASNPEDTGYGAFQNVLALLGANQQAQNQSNLTTSQQARTYSGQQIGAMDNAYLSQVAAQQAQAQNQLDTEKRAAALQLMALLATPGTKAPALASLGIS